ncbi:MAG: proline dehydrogenase family protein [Bacteroidota bacterium]
MSERLHFEDTAIAFAYKDDAALKRARLLFSFMHYSWLVRISARIVPWLIKNKFPLEKLIQKTLFRQFVGGVSLIDCKPVIEQLNQYHVQTILDYGSEGGKDTEEGKDRNAEFVIKAIEFAESKIHVRFVSIKITSIASFEILMGLNAYMQLGKGSIVERYHSALQQCTEEELMEWKRVEKRIQKVASIATLYKMRVLVDAEESWIQDSIDGLVMSLMPTYNENEPILYNTIQLYRHDRLAFLKESHLEAKKRGYVLGVKLVRGAYMEKERARAKKKGHASPIQPNKESTDLDFNAAVTYCIDHYEDIAVVLASHNEACNLEAVRLLQEKKINTSSLHFHFSQLFGMSDHITFTLAKAGYSVSKYIPYGPVHEVVPYLMRRAQENTSVQGQSSRELALINKEMKRRGL